MAHGTPKGNGGTRFDTLTRAAVIGLIKNNQRWQSAIGKDDFFLGNRRHREYRHGTSNIFQSIELITNTYSIYDLTTGRDP